MDLAQALLAAQGGSDPQIRQNAEAALLQAEQADYASFAVQLTQALNATNATPEAGTAPSWQVSS
jgi:hypothetical protein